MNWILKPFNELTLQQLYSLMQLRTEVFIVEQNCPYQDADGKDMASYHLLGYEGDLLVAYTRLLPAGVSFAEPSIGRVVTSPKARRNGFGRMLMEESIRRCYDLFGEKPIRIGAQLYLENFYASLGFKTVSDVYLEDNIKHVEMLLPADQSR